MKRLIALLLMCTVFFGAALSASAEAGRVTYDGNSQEFIFVPGSDYSPTDLFPNFKGVMPGDSIEQPITVKNEASKDVKVKIYMRSHGASPGSEDFLSQLHLRVEKVESAGAYMFDAAADETAQLTDWVLLGTLYSGGEVDLNVILDVPVTLGNEFSEQVGYLDWEFRVEEFPIEEDDPEAPDTGDSSDIWLWVTVAAVSAILLIILLIAGRKNKKDKKNQ